MGVEKGDKYIYHIHTLPSIVSSPTVSDNKKMILNDDDNLKENSTYSVKAGAVTGRGEADLDDAADMFDPPAAEALRDPPDSDSDGREGERPEKASGM